MLFVKNELYADHKVWQPLIYPIKINLIYAFSNKPMLACKSEVS